MSDQILKSALLLCVLVVFAVLDAGPLATPALAQRSDRSDDDDERRRGSREEWRRRWRERSENGEERGESGRRRGGRGEDRSGEDDRDRGRDNRAAGDRGRDRSGTMDTAEYARNLVKQFDKNSNMMLEGDERAQLRGPAATADLNNDDVITVDELVARLSNRESSNRESSERVPRDRGVRDEDDQSDPRPSTSSTTNKTRVFTGSARGGGSGKESADKRRSYRFTPPTERLGTDLPRWFKSRDRNEDGQVAMSEYSRTWSERMVREFQRYDLNNDGVITPKEAARE